MCSSAALVLVFSLNATGSVRFAERKLTCASNTHDKLPYLYDVETIYTRIHVSSDLRQFLIKASAPWPEVILAGSHKIAHGREIIVTPKKLSSYSTKHDALASSVDANISTCSFC